MMEKAMASGMSRQGDHKTSDESAITDWFKAILHGGLGEILNAGESRRALGGRRRRKHAGARFFKGAEGAGLPS